MLRLRLRLRLLKLGLGHREAGARRGGARELRLRPRGRRWRWRRLRECGGVVGRHEVRARLVELLRNVEQRAVARLTTTTAATAATAATTTAAAAACDLEGAEHLWPTARAVDVVQRHRARRDAAGRRLDGLGRARRPHHHRRLGVDDRHAALGDRQRAQRVAVHPHHQRERHEAAHVERAATPPQLAPRVAQAGRRRPAALVRAAAAAAAAAALSSPLSAVDVATTRRRAAHPPRRAAQQQLGLIDDPLQRRLGLRVARGPRELHAKLAHRRRRRAARRRAEQRAAPLLRRERLRPERDAVGPQRREPLALPRQRRQQRRGGHAHARALPKPPRDRPPSPPPLLLLLLLLLPAASVAASVAATFARALLTLAAPVAAFVPAALGLAVAVATAAEPSRRGVERERGGHACSERGEVQHALRLARADGEEQIGREHKRDEAEADDGDQEPRRGGREEAEPPEGQPAGAEEEQERQTHVVDILDRRDGRVRPVGRQLERQRGAPQVLGPHPAHRDGAPAAVRQERRHVLHDGDARLGAAVEAMSPHDESTEANAEQRAAAERRCEARPPPRRTTTLRPRLRPCLCHIRLRRGLRCSVRFGF